MIENINKERMHGDVKEHKHAGYDYWHQATRTHNGSTRDELPAGHVLSKKPLSEKLVLDMVEVSPIQMMQIGANLEIGAVQSLMEGLKHHRYAASCLVSDSFTLSECTTGVLFYAEGKPNYNNITHRYLIEVSGENVYVGYFPYDGRKPRLYGIHHRKHDVVKFLHKTHKPDLQCPELTLLTELNIPNICFELEDLSPIGAYVTINHKQGRFYTRSIYGDFTPLSECKFIFDSDSDTHETIKGHWDELVDFTGYNIGNPKHPWYMFQGATGYVQLFEGKMFCYPDGSIRFLTKEQEETIFRQYTDLQIVQGDLVDYELQEGVIKKEWDIPEASRKINLDRHKIVADKTCLLRYNNIAFSELIVAEDCVLTITHPEHGECKYEACKGEMLALLPGTSRPFQKEAEGRD